MVDDHHPTANDDEVGHEHRGEDDESAEHYRAEHRAIAAKSYEAVGEAKFSARCTHSCVQDARQERQSNKERHQLSRRRQHNYERDRVARPTSELHRQHARIERKTQNDGDCNVEKADQREHAPLRLETVPTNTECGSE